MTQATSTSRSLNEWLAYLESIHPTTIELGLERVGAVANQLSLTELSNSKVITVAGTNGKGSTCAYIEQCLLAAGYSVGVYSSPHITDYKERVRINSQMLSEQAHCQAFAAVEAARGTVSLSYFEFGTLAAIWLLQQQAPDVVLLEVGLGGRLDATNIVEPDVAVVTTVDIDHQAFLGDDINQIGFEKAGIFRPHKPAILGDAKLPPTVLQHAQTIAAKPIRAGFEFQLNAVDGKWCYQSATRSITAIDEPRLPVENMATAIAVIEAAQLDCDDEAIRTGLARAALPGRWQTLQTKPWVVADVAHNPQSTRLLSKKIAAVVNSARQVHGVVAMLGDKDSQNSLQPMKAVIDHWYLAGLDVPRGADANHLAEALADTKLVCCQDVATALRQALESASEDDMVVVFGSFYTVAEAQQLLQGNSFE
ncbi:bifunctional tetrahydrofolate synthase/dihydrofolate synthase [Neiella marina]|uniref:Dihydrofolate synthase/folylpolyglutamate synthase n=1 Tax=Neiella holothuriorum TaxID=2870530 RepID=A0ABS7EDJ6_9GAMM|nr:bifunctional tetrahydrofolate synthase/dihydrofolate synthase [Neiella holothuriorum]MBW8190405.1 bifunctional tetrahydrofolate synthase/dihydrofolate synthase [Neiella holothuriorum]